MNNFLIVLALILLIGWAMGFFLFALGQIIHLLLLIGIVVLIFRLVNRKNQQSR